MGLVYKAFDRSLHRYVALKVLSLLLPQLALPSNALFVRRRQLRQFILHLLFPIHSVSEIDGLPYIVMHFATGVNLQEHINTTGPLGILSAIKVAHQIAQGLFAAHQQGIIHRDVKPANIILEPSVMRAALTDFGLALVADDASLTHSGMTPGTPSYMSPEQATGAIVDHRSDWYSFGCVLYTMLVGHPPFRGQHAFEVLTRLQREEPKSPSHHRREIPSWLDKLVMMLLTKRAELRLADGERIVNLLNDVQQHMENPSQNALPKELQTTKNVRKGVWIALLLALTIRAGYMLYSAEATNRLLAPQQISNSNATQFAQEPLNVHFETTRQPTENELRQAARLQLELSKLQDEQSWTSMLELDDDITAAEWKP